MKKLFALLAVALTGFGVVAAEAIKLDGAKINNPQIAHDVLLPLTIEEAKQLLADVKADVAKREADYKIGYALLDTATFARENPTVDFAALGAHFDEVLATFEIDPEVLKSKDAQIRGQKLLLGHGWFTGVSNRAWAEAAVAAYKGDELYVSRTMAQLVAGVKGLEAAVPIFMQSSGGRGELVGRYFGAGEPAKGVKLYWDSIAIGQIEVTGAIRVFPQILAYELEQENFDAAALKSKLNKAILIYKSRARQWKPSKEGEANPYVEFVGMLQDTAKDL